MARNIIISKGEDGFFIANVPSLPGCFSQGKTYAAVLKNITEAIELYTKAIENN
ncbi:type II toxin-antitoxin system HicB family antitoxin [Candidatus Peregrinibacteria bacterium]|nr:type II toxin-antitoxin system HicB family antitoxin [Candidatus Peregrinibacteria bacterium]